MHKSALFQVILLFIIQYTVCRVMVTAEGEFVPHCQVFRHSIWFKDYLIISPIYFPIHAFYLDPKILHFGFNRPKHMLHSSMAHLEL